MVQDEISFTDLIASSIHDMKNSLNMQVSVLEKIALQCRDKGDAAMYDEMGGVIYQTSRMNFSLVELLSLYKLGKAIYPVDMDESCVVDVLQEAVMQTRFMMDHKGISVTLDCAPDCYWTMDRELIRGVLVNALNNAYHYTKDAIRMTALMHDKLLELRVEDNGAGFPAHMLLAGDVTSERAVNFETGSTGLGFYFSNQVARLHKNGKRRGALSLENGGALGGGCFVIRLP